MWYIFRRFGVLNKKNLATLKRTVFNMSLTPMFIPMMIFAIFARE
jgi:hypothetical protein